MENDDEVTVLIISTFSQESHTFFGYPNAGNRLGTCSRASETSVFSVPGTYKIIALSEFLFQMQNFLDIPRSRVFEQNFEGFL